jgi:nucleotide-binding universal stress UspA family protein
MFNNVLVGVDGGPGGRDAVALASRLIDPSGKLTLAHVHSGPLHPSHAVTPGLLHEEREALANTVDLLIVGSRGYGPMKRMMLGSTSSYLERHGRCSLLVLPRNLLAETTDEEQSGDYEGARARRDRSGVW